MKDRLDELQKNALVKYKTKTEEIEMDIKFDTKIDNELDAVFKEIEKIRGWINEINAQTQNMKIIYSNATFSTSPGLQSEMDSNIATSTALGFKACGALREFESKLDKLEDNTVLSRITKIQYATTKQLCSDALTNHEKFLTKYKQSKMSLLQQQMRLTNQSLTEEECQNLLEKNDVSLFVNNYCSETKTARLQLQDVEIRHKEIIKIENALKEVKEMFIQLAFLVHSQQEQINTIEYFATQATGCVDKGNEELYKGQESKQKSTKKKRAIIICLSVGFIILLLILFAF